MADTATPETTQPTTTATIPDQPTAPAPADTQQGQSTTPQTETPQLRAAVPDQPVSSASGVLLPAAKRGGLAGVMDEVRNWIAGTNSSQVYIDPQTGDRYVQHPLMTPKQQWLKVGGEALVGAASGLAAGKGAGNSGRALLAGVQAQHALQQEATDRDQNNAEQEYARTRQTRIDKANSQVVQMQLAEGSLRMDRMQTQATQDLVKWSMDMDQYYETQHAQDLGTYSSDDIHNIQKAHPDVWAAHFNDNSIRSVAQYKPDGTPDGVKFYLTHPSEANQPVSPDLKLHQYVRSDDATKPGTLQERAIPPGMTQGEYDTIEATQGKSMMDDTERIAKLADTKAQTEQRIQAAKEAPYRIAEMVASTQSARSETALRTAQAKALNNATDAGTIQSNAQQLVEGTADPSNLSKRSKSYDATLAAANAYSMATTGRSFDMAKAIGDYKYATMGTTANTLRYLNSLVGRDNNGGNLQQLVNQSNQLKRTEFPALNNIEMWAKIEGGNKDVAAYRTTVLEVADQVAKILQGGGSGGGGTSDAKLKQAQELFDKGFNADQIKGIADDLRPLLGNRKNEMIGDNRYLQRWYTGTPQTAQVQTGTTAAPSQIKLANGNIGVVQNGAWVDTGQKAPQ